jgi:hypothetical protein
MIKVEMRASCEGIALKAADLIDEQVLVLTAGNDECEGEDSVPRTKMSDETSGRVPIKMEIGIWMEDPVWLGELTEGLEQFCKQRRVQDTELYLERMLEVTSGRVEKTVFMMLHNANGRAERIEGSPTTDMMRFTSGRRPYESDSD